MEILNIPCQSLAPPPPPSLRDVELVKGCVGARPIAAFFTSYPEIIVPCNLSSKFWHSEIILLYREEDGSFGLDLFDRGGMVDSRLTATFLRTKDTKQRLKWHHVRAFKMDPKRGFYLKWRVCFRHIDLRQVPASLLQETLERTIISKLHPEGFDFFGHCCYNFAEDLLQELDQLKFEVQNANLEAKKSTYARYEHVTIYESNICACFGLSFGRYLQYNGYEKARVNLAQQEFQAQSSPFSFYSTCCLASRSEENLANEDATLDICQHKNSQVIYKQPSINSINTAEFSSKASLYSSPRLTDTFDSIEELAFHEHQEKGNMERSVPYLSGTTAIPPILRKQASLVTNSCMTASSQQVPRLPETPEVDGEIENDQESNSDEGTPVTF
mmetsp:Transcript_15576/g.20591  ORF Transcript_15576/g.20591 Transcript_15576/m.20591 type:complete len:386 (-) Transcript_15576:150-1307(-)|eukprot:CAMPEP_0197292722 /NCGR_PEP_ID=MMETSP0890-20130614/24715_1 /TAXON_ID=44058 ORGANISM="Aureoumbra lagunensis, Strain CCMP1510" /NCGR_SAMPLE_ID=MMETSP0890 /ASSEMBLY_ACC=CAM_ASM_000533 /LENGTH=385 /DNA_ID=CAMNT_0042766855 /DNA_START=40 /DNA_END=1197 /DNA_ORIENTATION=+